MKTFFPPFICILAGVLLLVSSCTEAAAPAYDIVPRPVQLRPEKGTFKFNAKTRIAVAPQGEDWTTAAAFFQNFLATAGLELAVVPETGDRNTVQVLQDDSIAHPEGYRLDITPKAVTVRAKSAAGAFYAFQTLRQLLPAETESGQQAARTTWTVPCAVIEDAPRFGYRGLMLDVARHFFTVDEVKQYIDIMAMLKMNRFHWHLTDDQGWRLAIKKYPRLTEVGAWRNATLIGHYSDKPRRFDSTRYGGFYTAEDVREVLQHAQSRFVEVIPEIDLPGHMSALLTAYPEYGCTGGPYKVQGDWGVFEDLLMPSEATFSLLEDIFAEVIELFPGRYIHLGGDEAVKPQWKKSPAVQAFMRRHGMKTEEELQSYFIRRVANFVSANGREVIGWDEILEGGQLPPATIVMSWRGIEGGIEAAKHGNRAIMSPTSYAYLDYYQSDDKANEPLAIGGFLPVDKVYSYEPLPEQLTPEQSSLIIGVQANLWTEYIGDFSKLQYMLLPRACAISEIQWTPADTKNYEEFTARLTGLFKRFDAAGINYAKHVLSEEPR